MEDANIRALLQKAQMFYQQGRLNQAINEYLKIKNIDPYNIQALNALGDIYSRLGDLQKAYSMYQKVANLYKENNELTRAIGIYKKIIKLDEDNGYAYYELGKLYENEGMTTDALNCYVKATELLNVAFDNETIKDIYSRMSKLDPDNIELHLDMAKKFIDSGNKNEARDEILTVIKSYLKHGEIEKAEGQISLLSSIVSEEYVNFAKALIAQAKEDYATAEKLLKQVIQKQPYFVDAYFELGMTRLKGDKGNKSRAKVVFNQCQNIQKDYIPVLEVLGDIYLEENNKTAALKKYQEALEFSLEKSLLNDAKRFLKKILKLDPNNIAAREKLKQLGENVDEFVSPDVENKVVESDTDETNLKEAAKTTEEEIETSIPQNIMDIPPSPHDLETKRKIADLLDEANILATNQGKMDEAEKYYKKVLELDPNNEYALKTLAENAMFIGNYDEALNYYKHLIKVYFQRVDFDNALNIYERAKKLKPDDKELDLFKDEIIKKRSVLTQVEEEIESEPETIEEQPSEIPQEAAAEPTIEKTPSQQTSNEATNVSNNQDNIVQKIDKNEVLGADLDEAMDNFQDLADAQMGDDAESHFQMGMSFYSMQLYSKAIVEFQKVIKIGNSEHYLSAVEQIAQCFLDQGFYEAAIKWINKGLNTENISEEGLLAFKFLLGQALEQMGDKEKALQVYLEVYEINARFRKVNRIIKKLKEELNIKKQQTVADSVNQDQSLGDLIGQDLGQQDQQKKNDDNNDEPPSHNPKISYL